MKAFMRVFSGLLLVCTLGIFSLWRYESLPDVSKFSTALQDAVGQIGAVTDLIEGGIPIVNPIIPPKNDADGGEDIPYVEADLVAAPDEAFESTMLAAIAARETVINVSALKMDTAQFRQMISRFFFTHPELFYVSTAYRIGTIAGSTTVRTVQLEYLMDEEDIPAAIDEFNASVDEICAGVLPSASDFDKILYLHDYFVKNYSYDHEGLADGTAIRDAYNFFVQKTGVCQAYMLGLIAVCNEVGLECLPVTSTEMNHAWNLVKVDGEWYHIDVTWDDAGGESGPVYPSYISYDYFLLSGEKLYTGGRNVHWDTTERADDSLYDDAIWRGEVHLPMVKRGESYYCIFYEGMSPVIYAGSPTQMQAVKALGGVSWGSPNGGSYLESWAGFAVWGEDLIFNTAQALWRYNVTSNEMERIADLSDALGDLQIFGIVDVEGGVVTFVAAADYHGSFELRTYQIT